MTTSTFSLAGHDVHRVGFGAMQLPGPGVFGPPPDHDRAIAVLRRAVDLGVDHIDTSQFYGPDVANELIREALHPYSDELALVSKVGAARDERGGWLPAQLPDQLREGVEANLRTLGVEQLAAVNLRRMDAGALPDGVAPVPLTEQLGEMVALRDEGKIAGVGISNATLADVETAIEEADVVCVQNPFSLLDQHDRPVLDRCAAAGIAYVPYFPLGSAFPGLPKVVEDPVVLRIAERLGSTPAQVGLAWLLGHRENILLIPGTSSVAHLEQNVGVADLELTARDVADLDAVTVPAAG